MLKSESHWKKDLPVCHKIRILRVIAAGQIVLQLARKDNLRVIHVRPFNHFGPGQQEGFVVSDFCSQIVSMERGVVSPLLKVGNLNAARDFTDVRDVVEA